MFNCPHCGRPLPDDSVFCEGCGTPISRYGAVQVNSEPKEKKKRKSPVLVVVIAVVCIAVLLFLTLGLGPLMDFVSGGGSSASAASSTASESASDGASDVSSAAAEGDSSSSASPEKAFIGTYQLVNSNGSELIYLAKDGKAAWAQTDASGAKSSALGSWTASSGEAGSLTLGFSEGTAIFDLAFKAGGEEGKDTISVVNSSNAEFLYERISTATTGMPTSSSSGSSSASSASSSAASAAQKYENYIAFDQYENDEFKNKTLLVDNKNNTWAVYTNTNNKMQGENAIEALLTGAVPEETGTVTKDASTGRYKLVLSSDQTKYYEYALQKDDRGKRWLYKVDEKGNYLSSNGTKVDDSFKECHYVQWYPATKTSN